MFRNTVKEQSFMNNNAQPLQDLTQDQIALKITKLSVAYHQTLVLEAIDFEIKKGTMLGIIGPNGAGKSTFLKACLGLIPTVEGEILFFDHKKCSKQEQQSISYVPQRESVDWYFPISALDVVLMGFYASIGWGRCIKKTHKEKALKALDRLGMSEFANRPIGQLSGGQQQRVFIARALVQDADLYFLDEPFAGIDAPTEEIILKLLKALQEEGKTIICVHHDLNTAKNYFNSCMLLNRKVIEIGDINQVLTNANLCRTYGRPCDGAANFCFSAKKS